MVDLVSSANVTIIGPTPVTADANGRAAWNMTCTAPGPTGLTVTIDSVNSIPLTTPDCGSTVYVPPTTTTTIPGSTSTSLIH